MSTYRAEFDGVVRELKTEAVVSVCEDFGDRKAPPVRLVALWDTGAYSSVISDKVISALGLVPVNHMRACGVNGWYDTPVYVIDLMLPNKIKVTGLCVSRGDLITSDMLIGMDIMSKGDFKLTNADKTCFTIRVPAEAESVL